MGQGIIDSGVPCEQIWLTSKLWPSDYANAFRAIDERLDRLLVNYLDCLYLHHLAGDYMDTWRILEDAYRHDKVRALGISNFNLPDAFQQVVNKAQVKPQIM